MITMKNEFRNQLVDIYSNVHQYVYHTLSDVKPESYNWTPPNTKARSIASYFRHLVNAEIYWLQAIQTNAIPYITKNDSFDDMINKYKSIEQIYNQLLQEAQDKDLEIIETKYKDDNSGNSTEIVQRGTLAWTVLRISIHALGHMSQITYILYALGVRGKEDPEYNWWNMTEKLIALGNLAKN